DFLVLHRLYLADAMRRINHQIARTETQLFGILFGMLLGFLLFYRRRHITLRRGSQDLLAERASSPSDQASVCPPPPAQLPGPMSPGSARDCVPFMTITTKPEEKPAQ